MRDRAKHLASLALLGGFLLLNTATSKARRPRADLEPARFREYCESHRDDPCCALETAWAAAGTPSVAADGLDETWYGRGRILKIRAGYESSDHDQLSPPRIGRLEPFARAEDYPVDDLLAHEPVAWDPIVRTYGPSVVLMRDDGPPMAMRVADGRLLLIGYEKGGALECLELDKVMP
jgi:hypothetical protein